MKPAAFLSALVSTILFAATCVSAAEGPEFLVKVRDGRKLGDARVMLKDLESKDSFAGKHFTVVKGSTDKPIRFDADRDLVFRAATIYHHMTVARDWFAAQPGFDDERFRKGLEEKTLIRLDQVQPFSETIHFETTGREVYNGCRTIAPSRDWEKDDEIPAWGFETWFYAPKKVSSASAGETIGKMVNSPSFKDPLRENLLYGDFMDASRDALDGQIDPVIHGISIAFTLGLTELVPALIENVGKLFKTSQRFDASLVPEVIYHEYAHTVLGHILNPHRSTALNEGFPNYFAYKISGLKNLAAKTGKKISKGYQPKKGELKNRYTFAQDFSVNLARNSYTYSLLVDVEQALGEDGFPVIVASLEHLEGTEPLKGEFEGKLRKGVDSYTDDPAKREALKLLVRGVMRARGL